MLYLLQLYWFYAIVKVMVKAATGSKDYKKQEAPH
jgi:tmRNA-binding protein